MSPDDQAYVRTLVGDDYFERHKDLPPRALDPFRAY